MDDPLDRVRDFTIAERLDDGTEVPVEPDSVGHSIVTEGFQSQWSYEAEDETRTWVFRYRVACAVDVYSETAHLYWQFIGTGWDKPTEHADITVHLRDGRAAIPIRQQECEEDGAILDLGQTPLERGDVRAFGHGPLNGEVTFVDPQTIRYEVRDVPPLSYVEGSILFPTDAVPTAVSTASRACDGSSSRRRSGPSRRTRSEPGTTPNAGGSSSCSSACRSRSRASCCSPGTATASPACRSSSRSRLEEDRSRRRSCNGGGPPLAAERAPGAGAPARAARRGSSCGPTDA